MHSVRIEHVKVILVKHGPGSSSASCCCNGSVG